MPQPDVVYMDAEWKPTTADKSRWAAVRQPDGAVQLFLREVKTLKEAKFDDIQRHISKQNG